MIVDTHVHVVSDDPRALPAAAERRDQPVVPRPSVLGAAAARADGRGRRRPRGPGAGCRRVRVRQLVRPRRRGRSGARRVHAGGVHRPPGRRPGAPRCGRCVAAGARGYRWFCVHDDPRVDEPRALWDALADARRPGRAHVPARRPRAVRPRSRPVPGRVVRRRPRARFVDLGAGIPERAAARSPRLPNVFLKVSTHALHTVAAHGDPADAVAELALGVRRRGSCGGPTGRRPTTRPYPDIVEEGRSGRGEAVRRPSVTAYLAGTARTLWPELGPTAAGRARTGYGIHAGARPSTNAVSPSRASAAADRRVERHAVDVAVAVVDVRFITRRASGAPRTRSTAAARRRRPAAPRPVRPARRTERVRLVGAEPSAGEDQVVGPGDADVRRQVRGEVGVGDPPQHLGYPEGGPVARR